jgi:hypothetical protein
LESCNDVAPSDFDNVPDATDDAMFLNDNLELAFGTTLTNFDWLELFQSEL